MKRGLSIVVLLITVVLMAWTAQPASALTANDNGTVVTASQGATADNQQAAQAQLVAERKKKPWYKSRTAKIVGGSAGAGAVVGGLVGGGKGAAAGALVGGGAGYIYDRKTRNKR